MSSPQNMGAGLGGMVLGQCLKAKNIPVTILEKASASPRFSYSITLHRSVYQRLLPVLQMDEASFIQKCSIGAAGVLMDSVATPTFHCHRGRLEGILRKDLDIRWEQCVNTVQITPQGILMRVENGPMQEIDTLIGADGVHSLIRKSLVPSCDLNVLPCVVFNGRRSITLKEYQHKLKPHMASQAMIQALFANVLFRVYINQCTATDVHVGYIFAPCTCQWSTAWASQINDWGEQYTRGILRWVVTIRATANRIGFEIHLW